MMLRAGDQYTLTVLDNISRNKGLKMLRLPENVGSSSARQIGIDEAKGRYILLVDRPTNPSHCRRR